MSDHPYLPAHARSIPLFLLFSSQCFCRCHPLTCKISLFIASGSPGGSLEARGVKLDRKIVVKATWCGTLTFSFPSDTDNMSVQKTNKQKPSFLICHIEKLFNLMLLPYELSLSCHVVFVSLWMGSTKKSTHITHIAQTPAMQRDQGRCFHSNPL